MTKARSNATAEAAKGDLRVGTGTNLSGILSAGNNGETLVLDSSTSTGLRYQAHTEAGKNFIINGGQDVWQRGTSIATSGTTYTGDRFETWSTAGAATTTSRQLTNDTTNLPGIQYCARVQRNSGQTLTGAIAYQTSLETVNSIPLAGKPIVVSFYARAGANYSAASSLLTVKVITGTGTDQKVSGYTGAVEIISTSVTLTTTWQRFQLTATVGATATEIGFQPYSLPTGTAGANDYYEITGIQLELGSVASTFSRAGGTIQGELAACQRYYWRSSSGTTYTALSNFGTAISTTQAIVPLPQKVSLRATPTVLDFSNLGLSADGVSTATAAVSAAAFSNGNITSAEIQNIVVTSTGLTQFRPYALYANNSSAGYIAIGAEL